jgi:hypothetical protein
MKKTSAKMQVLWFFKNNGYGKQETKKKSHKEKP